MTVQWEFSDRQPTDGTATPVMFWVHWNHRPDGVLGNVCVECLQPWPCAPWRMLRTVVVATMNLPFDNLLDFARQNLEVAAAMQEAERERAEREDGEKWPINLAEQKRRRRGATE